MIKSEIFLLSCILFCFSPSKSQKLYDDFEDPSQVSYEFKTGVLLRDISNPDQSGINSSATCGKYTRNKVEMWDVILLEPNAAMNDLSEYLSGAKKMTMMVKTDVSVTVQITLENSISAASSYPTGRHSEYLASTSGSGDWELLTFNFNEQPDAGIANTNVDRMVILFDPGNKKEDTYYIDKIMGPEFVNPCDITTPNNSIGEDFDCQRNVSFNFLNGSLTITDNPMKDGNNPSNKCAQFIKWTDPTDGAFGGALKNSFTVDEYISARIDLYDPNAPQKLLLSLQDGQNINLATDSATTIISDDWITYSFNFPNISPSEEIENFAFVFNPHTETEDTIYLDNFTFSEVLSINKKQKGIENKIILYPNPIQQSNQIAIDLESDGLINTIEIMSIDGKNIETILINSKKALINMSQYSKGIYLAKIVMDNNTSQTRRITK